MRLGVAEGPLPLDPSAVDERVAAKIRDLGFDGVFAHFGYGSGAGPDDIDPSVFSRAREALETHGVRIVQSWGWNVNFVHPDGDVRAQHLRRFDRALAVAELLGADGVTMGSGSHNPRGLYWPHRDNHTKETRDRLVASLREAGAMAESRGLVIALENHVMTTLDTPERVRDVLDDVDSPGVRLNVDPVNFVGDLEALWSSTQLIERIFDVLGEYAVCGHVKDVYAEDRLVVHLSETYAGDGELDLATYFRRFEALLPDGYLFLEHLPEELMPRAKRHVDDLLAELGIEVRRS
jgi:sugar phosphate isomerase/epimerase